jgi:hypothetical protein
MVFSFCEDIGNVELPMKSLSQDFIYEAKKQATQYIFIDECCMICSYLVACVYMLFYVFVASTN